MTKISFKIALPIVLTGLFAIIIFIATEYENLNNTIYIIFLILSIYTFLFGFAIGQNFASPIKKLLRRATELSEGDLKTRIYLETKDELGELSKVFNKIAQDLEDSRIASERVEEAVGIKVKARTQLLEETINALEQKVKNRTLELERATAQTERTNQELMTKNQELDKLKTEKEQIQKNITTEISEKPKPKRTRKVKKSSLIKSDQEMAPEQEEKTTEITET